MRGQRIGVLAGLGTNTPLHFGIRLAPFDRRLSCAGALHAGARGSGKLPRWPERLILPTDWVKKR